MLTILESLTPELISRPDLADSLVATIDEEDQEELASVRELYWILGLMNPSVELYPSFLELQGEQVLGLFNLETAELLVVAESLPLNGEGKLTIVHELVHALQQKRFDAHTHVEESEANQDRASTMTALLEGDATVASQVYASANLTLPELIELIPEAGDPSLQLFERAPAVIQRAQRSCLRCNRHPASSFHRADTAPDQIQNRRRPDTRVTACRNFVDPRRLGSGDGGRVRRVSAAHLPRDRVAPAPVHPSRQWERREDKGDILTWHCPIRSVLLRLEGENKLIGIAPDQETLALIAKNFP